MLRVYAARPEAGQLVLQRFRFADTGKWFPLNIFNQEIDSLENCAVGSLPVQIIFPPFG